MFKHLSALFSNTFFYCGRRRGRSQVRQKDRIASLSKFLEAEVGLKTSEETGSMRPSELFELKRACLSSLELRLIREDLMLLRTLSLFTVMQPRAFIHPQMVFKSIFVVVNRSLWCAQLRRPARTKYHICCPPCAHLDLHKRWLSACFLPHRPVFHNAGLWCQPRCLIGASIQLVVLICFNVPARPG